MIRALTTSATGLEAQKANIERIANDLANANTDGYKRSRSEFSDLMYQTIKEPGGRLGAETQTPVGIQKGMGVRVGSEHKIFEQGSAQATYRPYDLMIEGTGFFPVQLQNGQIGYTRTGAFHLDLERRLVMSNGSRLIPDISIPPNAVKVGVEPNGRVKADLQTGEQIELGQIQLVTFPNEEGLNATGSNLYQPTVASGDPIQGIPGENGLGSLMQGALEGSNVNVANSMVEMIATQRGYEMNTKVMSAADQMLGATVNIK